MPSIFRRTVAVLPMGLLFASSVVAADEAQSLAKFDRWVTSLTYSANGEVLATVGGDSLQYRPGDVRLWNAKTGDLLATLEGHDANVWSAALSPDGNTLVTTSYNGKVIVWNIPERKQVAVLEKHKGWSRCAAFHPDGKTFATGAEDGTVLIWNIDNLNEPKEIKAHEAAVYALAFSPDGAALITGSTDKLVKLFDWQAATEKARLAGHEDAVWSVAVSADGQLLASAGADRSVRLWTKDGAATAVLYGHSDWVSDIAFTADNKRLVSCGLDRTVKVWDLETAVAISAQAVQLRAQAAEHQQKVQQASEVLMTSESQVEPAQKKAAALTAAFAARAAGEKERQVQEGVDKYKDNAFLTQALAEAKKAAEAAAKAADDAVKPYAEDKSFAETLKKIREAALADAQAEQDAAQKSAAELAGKVQVAIEQKATSQKLLEEAQAGYKDAVAKQFTNLGEYPASLWSLTIGPGGEIAVGCHQQGVKIYGSDAKELFPKQ